MAIELDINLLYQALTVALILAVTYVFGRIIARFFRETLKKAGIPETETIILASIVRYSAYLIGISIALGYLNIPTVSLWIALVLGVAVIGISARSTLDNIVSGYFLRTYGPFNIGDVIEADGRMGAIKDMTLMKTVMETPEHLVFSIPNSKIVQSEIYNFTRHKSECPVELEFELSQDADLEDVKLKILDIVSSYPRISVDKPVQIYLQRFTQRGLWLKILFFVPSFKIRLGARDFVASEIQKRSQAGEIPVAYSPASRQMPQNPRPRA
jgi:small-conductance mechanosensitive channel